MKKIKYILMFLLIGCNYPIYTYNTYDTIIGEEKIVKIEFKSEHEACRVQKRIAKYCGVTVKEDNILYMKSYHLECYKKGLFGDHGFIREKYRAQISKQFEL